ncbi:hypothetical protein ACFWY9_36200 [Amycolatopsis sp. NPDC059027]|uniref:hypothetical protein n=1 Tax=Amycolatopsis sp. NPDC059027 TaxID=3346709 RepID=UPI00366C9301
MAVFPEQRERVSVSMIIDGDTAMTCRIESEEDLTFTIGSALESYLTLDHVAARRFRDLLGTALAKVAAGGGAPGR